MESKTSTTEHAKEEIDLLDLLAKMFNAIGQGFIAVLSLLTRKSIWIVSFAMIGVVLSICLKASQDPLYSSMMIGKMNVFNNTFVTNAIQNLQQADAKDIARILGIPDTIARKIHSIENFYGIDKDGDGITDYIDFERKGLPKDDTGSKIIHSEFYLRIQLSDPNAFSVAENSVMHYLLSNPYMLKSDTIRKQSLQQNINAINEQLARLDSLQKAEYKAVLKESSLKLSNESIFLGTKDRQLYHGDILALTAQRNQNQAQLDLDQGPITVIQEFQAPTKVQKPLTGHLKIIVPLFMLLGFLCAMLWQYRKPILTLILDKHY